MAAAPVPLVLVNPVLPAAATPPIPAGDDGLEGKAFNELPSTKLYKLTKDLDSRQIKVEKALEPCYPEFFYTVNLENFDTDSLRAMFYDLQAGDSFLHFLQGARLSYRIMRGANSEPPANLGAILGRIRLCTVLCRAGMTVKINEALNEDNCDWAYDTPVSLPAAVVTFDEIKADYIKMFTKEGATPSPTLLSDAVLEISNRSDNNNRILLKAVKPLLAPVPAAPAAVPVAAPAPTAMAVDPNPYPSVKGSKRPRNAPDVVAATLVLGLGAATPKKRPNV